jgi:class 3 adenylate cyclase/Tol biopolymer transport system component
MALAEGSVLGGYRIVRLIGRGGMGAVYLADDVRLGRKVALKVLATETAEIPAVRDRFVRESHLAASLDHPNILPIYEAGEADGQLFIAMRYVPGPDLDGLIRRDGPLSLERTTSLIDQVASALDAAHAAGLIHRDVKPGNILVASGSQPGSDHAYLSDFGLTKQAEYSAALTRSGQLLGSVGYVAPELIENRPIDARVDVYSLGCVAYECLAGAQPYPRDTEMATLYAHVQAPPPSLAEVRPELPATIDLVIAKALAKSPDERYGSAGQLAQALARAAAPEAGGRHLTRGFLFSDLRGYTAFTEAHGDEAAATLLDAYRRLVRDVVRRSGGAEIKTEGDSFYVVFPSASDAVRCGLAIVAAAASARTKSPGQPIAVGIGIHAGETAETAEGYVGSAVNLAARICAQAAAGEVLVSDTVRGLTRTSSEVTFAARGRRRLKGIAEPMAVYAASAASAGDLGQGAGPPGRRPGTTRLAGFGGSRRRGAIAGAIGAVAVALVAILVAAGLGGAFRGASSPSALSQASGGAPAASSSVAGRPSANGPFARIVWSAEYINANPDLGAPCDPTNTFSEARLYQMSPDGSGPIRLIHPIGDVWEREPDWSPDGKRIVFQSGSSADVGGPGLWFTPPDGTSETGLQVNMAGLGDPFSPFGDPQWAPDSARLLFVQTGSVFVSSSDGTGVKLVRGQGPLGATSPPISALPGHPSEANLAFARSSGAPSSQRPFPDTSGAPGDSPAPPSITWAAASWGPAGKLTLVGTMDDGSAQVFLADVDGSHLTPLVLPPNLIARRVGWSPDGLHMAIAGAPLAAPTSSQIWTANEDGSGLEQVTSLGNNRDPAWSPDGTRLAFASDRDGHFEIYGMAADGSAQTRLTTTSPELANCWPTWGQTTLAVAAPTPTPVPGASPSSLGFHEGRLDPGAYLNRTFQPAVGFTVPAGWAGNGDFVDVFSFGPNVGDAGIYVARIQSVFPKGCIDDAVAVIGQQSGDVVAWVQKNTLLKIDSPVTPVHLAGRSGFRLDFSVRKNATCSHGPGVWLFPIGQTFQIRIKPTQAFEMYALDVNGTTVTLLLSGPSGAGFAAFLAQMQPVLDSLTFP